MQFLVKHDQNRGDRYAHIINPGTRRGLFLHFGGEGWNLTEVQDLNGEATKRYLPKELPEEEFDGLYGLASRSGQLSLEDGLEPENYPSLKFVIEASYGTFLKEVLKEEMASRGRRKLL